MSKDSCYDIIKNENVCDIFEEPFYWYSLPRHRLKMQLNLEGEKKYL